MNKNSEKINSGQLHKSESKIQQEIVQWFKNTYCLKHHVPRSMILSIPNEGRMERSGELISTGLYPGAADLFLLHPITIKYHNSPGVMQPVFFEIKTPDGVQSDKQKSFQDHCVASMVPYYLVRSLEEFQQVVESL